MPLIVVCGFPSSGKTSRAIELYNYFKDKKSKKVVLISENHLVQNSHYDKNEYFSNAHFEKLIRSSLKSQVIASLNTEDLVILDAGNYIKGYRYELYCASKLVTTTQCTLLCSCNKDAALNFNQNRDKSFEDYLGENNSLIPYSEQVFTELCQRFEEPNENCRWDKPLFITYPNEDLNLNEIDDVLYQGKKLAPNLSTQNVSQITIFFL
uniref:Protein KTI12 homolog n=1 Tax=Megaselia scalaris TaxID=36166 RepID=T1GGT5_MEGSC